MLFGNANCYAGKQDRLPFITSSSAVHSYRIVLHQKLFRILWATLAWTVRAFESRAFTEPEKGLVSNNVTTRHHHGRIFVRGLLFRNGADEDRVEVVGRW